MYKKNNNLVYLKNKPNENLSSKHDLVWTDILIFLYGCECMGAYYFYITSVYKSKNSKTYVHFDYYHLQYKFCDGTELICFSLELPVSLQKEIIAYHNKQLK